MLMVNVLLQALNYALRPFCKEVLLQAISNELVKSYTDIGIDVR